LDPPEEGGADGRVATGPSGATVVGRPDASVVPGPHPGLRAELAVRWRAEGESVVVDVQLLGAVHRADVAPIRTAVGGAPQVLEAEERVARIGRVDTGCLVVAAL